MLDKLYQAPQKAITYTWLTSLALLFITFLVMCIAVSNMSDGQHDRVTAFAGAWSVLLFMIISVVGTYFMSRFKSTFSIGVFAGVVFVMCNQMLIVCALFVERVKDNSADNNNGKGAKRAMAAFSFFMFTVYSVFAIFLVIFREKIGAGEEVTDKDTEDEEAERF